MAELERLVNEAPMTPEPDGPLPPLESDIPEWRAERWRAWAAGGRFGKHGSPRRPRPSSKALREWFPDAALLDVLCERRHILRVAILDGALEALWNVTPMQGGHLSANCFLLSGLTTLAVECRCGEAHSVSSLALQRLARKEVAGKPRVVGVSVVLSRSG